MRAVASVWPYITTRSRPRRRRRSAWRRTASGAMRPPAWVTKRSDGSSRSANPARSSRSKVWGTPAKLVTRCRRTRSQKQGSTTEPAPTRTLAPTARWLCSTDSP